MSGETDEKFTTGDVLNELEYLRKEIETLYRLRLARAGGSSQQRAAITEFFDRRLTAIARAMDAVRNAP